MIGVCSAIWSRLARDRRPNWRRATGGRGPRTVGSGGGAKMASQDHIRNPIEWGWDQITLAALTDEIR